MPVLAAVLVLAAPVLAIDVPPSPLEAPAIAAVAPANLRAWHDLLAREPHVAGTDGDRRMIETLARAFSEMGLDVETHWFDAYMARPLSASLRIVSPVEEELSLVERAVAEDPDSGHPALGFGFNAYSGSGEVEGEIVYANYGRKEDFALLREHGVDVRGRIVLARYGGNYRGFKVKFAEDAGAAGVLIYTDPRDSGYAKGLEYPEGPWANETSIQRGSIVTKPYPGDPLTPFVPATPEARRLEEADVDLPRIPVQPIGWGAAERIVAQMRGRALPDALIGGWQGGLPHAYRLEGGPDLRVRLRVEQVRSLVRTANVVARLEGAVHPEELIVLGCHHDAWGFGAADPLAGLICVMEAARVLVDAAAAGARPARTIAFAAWGAEEHGIIGSTEWVEANRDALAAHGAAYVNLDMAAMGPNLYASGAPALRAVVESVAQDVPAARDAARTAWEAWTADGSRSASLGALGGGSDHVGFACHVGVPSVAIGAGGSRGTSYHSNYDTLAWYRLAVGDDYEPAALVTRMAAAFAARVADAPLLPYAPQETIRALRAELARLDELATARDLPAPSSALAAEIGDLDARLEAALAALDARRAAGVLDAATAERANRALRDLERAWIDPAGLPGRPWYRSLWSASDPDSGYAAWVLPLLREAIEDGDAAALEAAIARHRAVLGRVRAAADELASAAGPVR